MKFIYSLALALLCATAAHADSFVISSGFGELRTNPLAPSDYAFNLSNSDGSIRAVFTNNPFQTVNPTNTCRGGCAPGSTVNFGFVATNTDYADGALIINGVSYRIGGEFRINLASVVLPSNPTTGSLVTYLLPFTFGGRLSQFVGPTDPAPVTTFDVSGSGQALVRLVYTGSNNLYRPDIVLYQAPVLTPEPATMILLGTGLSGIAAKLRRRKSKN